MTLSRREFTRLFAVGGSAALFAHPEFAALRGLLGPARPCSSSLKERLKFYLGIGQAIALSGPTQNTSR